MFVCFLACIGTFEGFTGNSGPLIQREGKEGKGEKQGKDEEEKRTRRKNQGLTKREFFSGSFREEIVPIKPKY